MMTLYMYFADRSEFQVGDDVTDFARKLSSDKDHVHAAAKADMISRAATEETTFLYSVICTKDADDEPFWFITKRTELRLSDDDRIYLMEERLKVPPQQDRSYKDYDYDDNYDYDDDFIMRVLG